MNGDEAVSFDEIIQAGWSTLPDPGAKSILVSSISSDRQRKKNEALAEEVFGRGRKPGSQYRDNRRIDAGGNFARRVGVAKVVSLWLYL